MKNGDPQIYGIADSVGARYYDALLLTLWRMQVMVISMCMQGLNEIVILMQRIQIEIHYQCWGFVVM